jgi:predicted nucleic acid-binding protein
LTGVIADSGPLYALAVPSDQHHAEARTDLERLAAARIPVMVLDSTLVEAHSLVLRRTAPRIALGWLNAIRSTATLVIPTEADVDAAVELIRQYDDQTITLADALVSVTSARLHFPVWTYDHHFDVLRANRWR